MLVEDTEQNSCTAWQRLSSDSLKELAPTASKQTLNKDGLYYTVCQTNLLLKIFLSSCPLSLLSRLQEVWNSAAKLVFKTGECDYAPPLLQAFHWLPVQTGIDYKLQHIYNPDKKSAATHETVWPSSKAVAIRLVSRRTSVQFHFGSCP